MSSSDRQSSLVLLLVVVVGFGLGVIGTSWITAGTTHQHSAEMERIMERMTASLAGFEVEFRALREDVRQARMGNDAMPVPDVANQMPRTVDQHAQLDDAQEAEQLRSTLPVEPMSVALTEAQKEQEAIGSIMDNLRGKGAVIYPDMPSLMTSSDMASLSPEARDEVMGEVSRMLERGELDPAVFFPAHQ